MLRIDCETFPEGSFRCCDLRSEHILPRMALKSDMMRSEKELEANYAVHTTRFNYFPTDLFSLSFSIYFLHILLCGKFQSIRLVIDWW